MDQAEGDLKALTAVRALLLNQGPPKTSDIPWVAVIGQSVAISSVSSSGGAADSSLEAAWRAEVETLKRLLSGAPQNKLGRVALVDTIAGQIRNRMSLRVPNLLSGYMLISQLIFGFIKVLFHWYNLFQYLFSFLMMALSYAFYHY